MCDTCPPDTLPAPHIPGVLLAPACTRAALGSRQPGARPDNLACLATARRAGNQGGSSVKILNKWVYDGKAKRDAAFALMNKVVPPAGNSAIWVGFPVGECSIYVVHQAKDLDSSTALSAAIGSNAEILETMTDVIGGNWYNFGTAQAGWRAEVDKWTDVIPNLIEDPNAKLITSIGLDSAGTNFNSDGLISVHDVKYNAAGDIHKWVDLLNSPAVIEAGQAAGMSATVFQTSSTTGINVFNFASEEQWLKFNEMCVQIPPPPPPPTLFCARARGAGGVKRRGVTSASV